MGSSVSRSGSVFAVELDVSGRRAGGGAQLGDRLWRRSGRRVDQEVDQVPAGGEVLAQFAAALVAGGLQVLHGDGEGGDVRGDVAGYWYDAAGAALWYRVAAFDDAERAAYQALHRAARGEWTRQDMFVLGGEIQDAQVEDDYQNRDLSRAVLQVAKGYNAALKGKPHQEPSAAAPLSPAPLTIRDQADLRWLVSQDWQWLMLQAAMLATARSAGADRHHLPWLSDALKRLRSTLAVAELEEIAEQWRERRSRYFDIRQINPRSSLSLSCCRAGLAPGGGGAGARR